MTYHDEVHDAAHEYAQTFRPRPVGRNVIADDALDSIPPLTLKTEHGRFVKVEQAGWLSPYGVVPGGMDNDPVPYWKPLYRIVEDPTQ
jgi:hypothetical protein